MITTGIFAHGRRLAAVVWQVQTFARCCLDRDTHGRWPSRTSRTLANRIVHEQAGQICAVGAGQRSQQDLGSPMEPALPRRGSSGSPCSMRGNPSAAAGSFADDEPARRRQHLLRGQRRVECLGKRRFALQPIQVGRVARLDAVDDQDRGQQRVLVDQELRRALVGAHAGVLQYLRHPDEPGQVGVAEVVLRLGHRLAAEVHDDLCDGVDVLSLVVADDAEPLVDVGGVAGDGEIVGRVCRQAVAVKGVLQVLQGQRVVEHVDRGAQHRAILHLVLAPLSVVTQDARRRSRAWGCCP
jgi:hypothetical protein